MHDKKVTTMGAEKFLDALRSGKDIVLRDSRIEGDIDLSVLKTEEAASEICISSAIRLENVTFTGRIDTRLKPTRFLAPVTLSHCSMETCDFSRANFDKDVRFDSVVFNGHADFWQASFAADASFFACQFRHPDAGRFFRTSFKTASFLASRFDGVLRFQEAKAERAINFDGVRFFATTYFNSAEFASAQFYDAKFAGLRADFTNLRVSEDISFHAASFESPTTFTGASIGGVFDLSHAVARQPIALLGCRIGKQFRTSELVFEAKVDAQWEDIRSPLLDHLRQHIREEKNSDDGRPGLDSEVRWALCKSELLNWSENFRGLGRNHDARAAGYEWTSLRRTQSGLSFWIRLGDRLLDIPSRRGTRPWRPVWIAAATVFTFAVLLAAMQLAMGVSILIEGAEAAPGYNILLLSLEKFMPIGAPTLIGKWEVHSSIETPTHRLICSNAGLHARAPSCRSKA